jgi:hypothetical protein
MDENPKTPLKKKWTVRRCLRDWLILLVATFSILLLITRLIPAGSPNITIGSQAWLIMLGDSLVIATIPFGLLGSWYFIRWLCSWHNLRRFLFGLACLATLIALFYAEEDWRGTHDWEKYQREGEAKGEQFSWQSVIAPPVPDDQNFAFSPVWIAEEKYNFLNEPERAEAWYGNRIYHDDVSKLVSLLPVSTSGLVGTNWQANPSRNLPVEPEFENTNTWLTCGMVDLKPWQNYYRALQQSNSAAQIPVTAQPQTPAQDVLLALSKFDPVIEQLRTDSVLPESRFPIAYEQADKAAILLPHLAALKRQSQVLKLRSLAELETGQTDQAAADINLSFRLISAIRTEPFFISQLVRLAILNIAFQPLWQGLAEHKWSEAQLVEFDRELASLDFLADYESSVRGERVMHTKEIEYLQYQRSIRKLNGLPDMSQTGKGQDNLHDSILDLVYYFLAPSGWFEQSKLWLSRFLIENYAPIARVDLQTVSVSEVKKAVASETAKLEQGNFIEQIMTPALGNAVKRFARGQAYVNLARVAIALERYRLAHGQYPESLDVLTPQYLSELPHDIINGQPLKYRRDPDGQFVLYSVGWNETDDGGVVMVNKGTNPGVNFDEGDWVWRYPARN